MTEFASDFNGIVKHFSDDQIHQDTTKRITVVHIVPDALQRTSALGVRLHRTEISSVLWHCCPNEMSQIVLLSDECRYKSPAPTRRWRPAARSRDGRRTCTVAPMEWI